MNNGFEPAAFRNGNIVRDVVTGYEGMIVATTLWLNGCFRYCVQAQKLQENGEPVKDAVFDEKQLELVASMSVKGDHRTGGPRPKIEVWRD